jgi:O-acetylserine/cysteine efflux transporter
MLLVLGVMILWGLNFAIAKIGLQQIPPIFLVAARFLLVAIILLPFAKRPHGQWGAVFAIAVVLGLLHFSFMFNGLKTVDAATAAIAIQLQVPFASLLAAVFFKDKLGWRRALGMAIAFAGVAVIAGEPRLGGQYLALSFVITACFIWAIANVMIKRLKEIDGVTLNAWMAVFATPMLFAASWAMEDGQLEALRQADFWAYFAVAYQAVAVVVIGYGCWYWLMRRYQMNQIMPSTLLVPFFGVMSGVVFLGESLTANLISGGIMTIAGVGIIILRRPRITAPQAERL